ncbi:MAG: YdcF family protein [Rhodanobacter sp.]
MREPTSSDDMVIYSHLFRISDPVTQALLIAIFGLLWIAFRRYRTGLAFIAFGALWVTACATPAFAGFLRYGLESQYPAQTAMAYPTADAIVVLGGGPLPPLRAANNAPQLAHTRLGFAWLLYKAGRAPLILVSGGDGSAIAMSRRLVEFGAPTSAIRIESHSANTYQNAELSAAILKTEGRNHILLVTSPDHMPRAMASFDEQGLYVIPAPSNDRHSTLDTRNPWSPRRAVLQISSGVLHEYIGLVVYKIRGQA